MFEELGISFGTVLIVLLALYFIIKWAVKNGIKEAIGILQRKSLLRILRQNKYVTKRKIVNKERCICYARYTRG